MTKPIRTRISSGRNRAMRTKCINETVRWKKRWYSFRLFQALLEVTCQITSVRTGASPALMLPADFPKFPQSTYGVGRISEQTKPPLINCSNLFKRTCASLNAFTTRLQIKHEPLELGGTLGQLAHGFKMPDRTVSQIHLLVLELPLPTDCKCRHRGMSG